MYCASTVVYGRRSDIIIIELLNIFVHSPLHLIQVQNVS